jgi:hypothetical protein
MLKIIRREFLHIFPIFLFFFIFFLSINWIETLLFEQVGISPFRFIEVFLAAVMIAKVVLIVDHLPITQRFRSRPLIYGIVWKTSLYWILLCVIRIGIRYVPFLFHDDGDFKESLSHFLHAVHWNLLISIQIYYLMLLFIFVTFQEAAAKIGYQKLRHLFFG